MDSYDAAITHANEALARQPVLADAYNVRGCAYLRLKQKDKAIADFQAALKINGAHVNARNNLDRVLNPPQAEVPQIITLVPDDR